MRGGDGATRSCHRADPGKDAGHVQVERDGRPTSLVDAILAARGLRRRVALVLPSAADIPFVVASTDLIATLPSRIVNDLTAIPGLTVIPAPLPPVGSARICSGIPVRKTRRCGRGRVG
jgi:DNA-binding transcriptional LysR family regulator